MIRALVAALVLVALARPALAHQSSVSYSQVSVRSGHVRWRVQIADRDSGVLFGIGDAIPKANEVPSRGAAAAAYVAPRLEVAAAGVTCPQAAEWQVTTLPRSDGFFVVVDLAFDCPPTTSPLALEYRLFFELDPRHRSIVSLDVNGRTSEAVFSRSEPRLVVDARARAASSFLLLGVEHILTGYDHLAFLVALLLVLADRLSRARLLEGVKTISAFTVSHSLTLLLAAFDVVRLPSWLVESAIAASILYVAVENLAIATPRHRIALTFGFGLVHGLGFASALAESGLPHDAVVGSVLFFNLGVELGQVGVLVVALPLLVALGRLLGAARVRRFGSVALAACAIVWLVQRLW